MAEGGQHHSKAICIYHLFHKKSYLIQGAAPKGSSNLNLWPIVGDAALDIIFGISSVQ
jgi:hypothetical protein